MPDSDETADIGLPEDRETAAHAIPYLREQLGLPPPLTMRRFTGGRANLTYLVRHRDGEVVLRRPPFGHVAPGSHDMVREHRVLQALSKVLDVVPRPLHLCTDEDVLGAPFFVVERRTGVVIRDHWPQELGGRPDARRQVSDAFLRAVVELHALDPDAVGLGSLGRPRGFMQRQFVGWRTRWCDAARSDGSDVDDVFGWLSRQNLPPQRPAVIHNDLKLDNSMFAVGEPGRLVAIFDWDMCTLGDPLADLGTILTYWGEAGDDPDLHGGALPPTALPGFWSRRELVDAYARATGVDVSAIAAYEVYGWMKLAVIGQQLLRRYFDGHSSDVRLEAFRVRVPAILREVRRLIAEK